MSALYLMLRDFENGLRRLDLCYFIAWEEMRGQYKRTLLSIGWVPLTFLAFLVVKIFVFGAIANRATDYFAAYVTLGFLVWQFCGSSMSNGCTVFIRSAGLIKGTNLPLSVFVIRDVLKDLIVLGINGSLALVLYTAFYNAHPAFVWISLLSVGLLLVFGVGVRLILGIVCVYLRDLAPFIRTMMRIAFFVTPIIWLPSQLGARARFVDWNPFAHMLGIVRTPLMDGTVPTESYGIVTGICLLVLLSGAFLFGLYHRRIAVAL